MTARHTEHEAFLDDRETTIAILGSQNAVAYEEIIGSSLRRDHMTFTKLSSFRAKIVNITY